MSAPSLARKAMCVKLRQYRRIHFLALVSIQAYTGYTGLNDSVVPWTRRVVWRQEVLKKLQVGAVLMFLSSYALAGTVSIGTASARGEMRVDSYVVKGNATLFDGTVVETGQATADLRMDKGTLITMSTSSRGTLYRDRLVLQQGESMLAASSSFQLEANGLHVTPKMQNSLGVVSLKEGNRVEVAALHGSFGVTNDHGVLVASVPAGHAALISMQTGGETPTAYSSVGTVSFVDGHYFLTDSAAEKFEITCKNMSGYVGKEVTLTGIVQAGATPAQDASSVICAKSVSVASGAHLTTFDKAVFTGVVGYTAAGFGLAISEANQNATPASR